MDTLVKVLEYFLRLARNAEDFKTRNTFFSQAFGALQYHIWTHLEEEEEVAELWNEEYRPKFEELLWSEIT